MNRTIGVGNVDITEDDIQRIVSILRSGQITAGPALDSFEYSFARVHDCRHGLMLNSGTDALRVALLACKELYGWPDGAKVIVPALTFIATSNIVIQSGLTPVFADVDPDTFNITWGNIYPLIRPETVAVIPVHLFGTPCDMTAIKEGCDANGLKIIEDACEATGAKWDGKSVGSFGEAGCFSTYAAHVISTGVGGLCTTNNTELDVLMRSYANHGRDVSFVGYRSTLMGNRVPLSKRFRFDRIGYSARATQLEAGMGIGQLQRLNLNKLRRKLAFEELRNHLEGSTARTQTIPEKAESAHMMFPIVLPYGMDREMVAAALDQGGIESRPFFDILGQKPYLGVAHCQISQDLSARGIYVGSHPGMSSQEINYVGQFISGMCGKRTVTA